MEILEQQSGNSLLELLMTLALLALVGFLSFPGIRSIYRVWHEQAERKSILEKLGRAETSLYGELERSRALNVFPSISLDAPASLQQGPPAHRPHQESAVLHFEQIETGGMLDVIGWESLSAAAVGVRTCLRGTLRRPVQDYNDWLVLGVDNAVLVSGRPKPEGEAEPACGEAYSAVFTAAKSERVLPLRIFPVADKVTVYRDRSGTLRRYSRRAGQSQPLAYQIERFSVVRTETQENTTLVTLELGATQKDGKVFTRTLLFDLQEPSLLSADVIS